MSLATLLTMHVVLMPINTTARTTHVLQNTTLIYNNHKRSRDRVYVLHCLTVKCRSREHERQQPNLTC